MGFALAALALHQLHHGCAAATSEDGRLKIPVPAKASSR
jgi:hypothetical protein